MKIYFVVVILLLLIIEDLGQNSVKRFSCPPGVREVACFIDPCFNQKCPADPTAERISSYCGGCSAVWLTSDGKKARCKQKERFRCPLGQKKVHCFKDPCQGETCPEDPSAKCISNYCGGCNFSWKKPNGKPAQCK